MLRDSFTAGGGATDDDDDDDSRQLLALSTNEENKHLNYCALLQRQHLKTDPRQKEKQADYIRTWKKKKKKEDAAPQTQPSQLAASVKMPRSGSCQQRELTVAAGILPGQNRQGREAGCFNFCSAL